MNRLLPLFLYLICFLVGREWSLVGTVLFLLFCWMIKYRDWTWIVLFVILVCFNAYTVTPQNYTVEGRIIQLFRNAVVIEQNGVSTLVTQCTIRKLDAKIVVVGDVKKIESAPTTYGHHFQTWAAQQQISHSIYAKQCTLIQQQTTLRSIIQNKIDHFDEHYRELLYKILLFVPVQEDSLWNVVNQLGLSIVGIIALLRQICKYFLNEQQGAVIEFILIITFSFVYQFPFVCVRYLLAFLIRYTKLNQHEKTGLLGCTCLVLFPHVALTLSFLIPIGLRVCRLVVPNARKIASLFWLVIIQSIFFSKIQLGLLLGYRLILPCFGLISCCAWIALFFNFPFLLGIATYLVDGMSWLSHSAIYGNPLGFGLIIYLILLSQIPRYKLQLGLVLYLFFCRTGLFHPLTEVLFVQIGQGDAIVIREAFSRSVTLIDVGDVHNYQSLQQALYARGIRVIDQIIITHNDQDHAGNIHQIQHDFKVKRIIRKPEDIQLRSIYFKALTSKEYSNENDNSLVYVVSINKVHFLLTGDISKEVEVDLVGQYDLSSIDVLKLAHHGSKTSTSAKLLIEIRCKLAINSSGLNNRYHHPHAEVTQRISNFTNYFLDTQKDGDISVFFLRNWNFFITSSKKIGIID